MFVKTWDSKAIIVTLHRGNFYEIKFSKMHGANATNLVQSPMGDDALKLCYDDLGHLNVKDICTL